MTRTGSDTNDIPTIFQLNAPACVHEASRPTKWELIALYKAIEDHKLSPFCIVSLVSSKLCLVTD
jgi:hypothetical protein